MIDPAERKRILDEILKRHCGYKKHFKINKSWGVYDAYKAIRKYKWLNIGRPLKEHEFYSIIRTVNNYIAADILEGKTVKLPGFGYLELRKHRLDPYIDENGKLVIRYPVDWKSTLDLWVEDEEARKNKTLIRFEKEWGYKICHRRGRLLCYNIIYYGFKLNQALGRKLTKRIVNGLVDTPILRYNYYDKGDTLH